MDNNNDSDIDQIFRRDEEYVTSQIYDHWPIIRSYVPDHAVFLDLNLRVGGLGLCTHPEIAVPAWVHVGWKRSDVGDPPDNFFWVGLQGGGAYEALFLMWFRHGRKFWFYDIYTNYYGMSDASTESTRERLDQALERWETTTEDVMLW